MPQTTIYLERLDDLHQLRRLAHRLGLYAERGPGAGREGSLTPLLARLAAAARDNLDGTAATLADLFALPESADPVPTITPPPSSATDT